MNEAHWEEPASQTNREVVFVSEKVLLFTQTRRSWSWVSPQAGCLYRGGLSVEDTTIYRGRPLPEPQGQLDSTQTCCQHLRGDFTPTKACSRSKPRCSGCADQHSGDSSSSSGWKTPAFFHPLLPAPSAHHREQGEAMDTFPSGLPPHLRSQEGNALGKDSWRGGEGPWSRPLVYQIDLCSIHLTRSKCSMNFGHYTEVCNKLSLSWDSLPPQLA